MTAVNAALTDLIARAPTLGNAKQVHWYSREVAAEDDPFELVIDADWDSEPVDTPAPEEQRGTEKEALRAASRRILQFLRDAARNWRMPATISCRSPVQTVA